MGRAKTKPPVIKPQTLELIRLEIRRRRDAKRKPGKKAFRPKDLREKVMESKVPMDRKIKVIFHPEFIEKLGFDPSKTVRQQATEDQRVLRQKLGDSFGNTNSIISSFRGRTLADVDRMVRGNEAAMAKIAPELRAASKACHAEKPGTPEYKKAVNRYTAISGRYCIQGHRQAVGCFLIASLFMKRVFPLWSPRIRERVWMEMPRKMNLFEPGHYEKIANRFTAEARKKVMVRCHELVHGIRKREFEAHIRAMPLEKAERALERLSSLERPKKASGINWGTIERIIMG